MAYFLQAEGPNRPAQVEIGSQVYQAPVVLTGSGTHDFASVNDGAQSAITTLTVPGAALGDFVLASVGVSQAGVIVHGYVSAANTVSVFVQNESGGAVDLASTTLRVMVFKAF